MEKKLCGETQFVDGQKGDALTLLTEGKTTKRCKTVTKLIDLKAGALKNRNIWSKTQRFQKLQPKNIDKISLNPKPIHKAYIL